MLILVIIVVLLAAEAIPLIMKKQGKEAFVLIFLGSITFAYGYYYTMNKYTASLVSLIFELLNVR